jgi:hypothetical protein
MDNVNDALKVTPYLQQYEQNLYTELQTSFSLWRTVLSKISSF